MLTTHRVPMPFQKPSPGEYDIVLSPNTEGLSLITVTHALGCVGIQALNTHYSNNSERKLFFSSARDVEGSFMDATVAADNSDDQTIFGFWAEDLSDNAFTSITRIAGCISDFLEKECKASVAVHIPPTA